MELGDVGRLLLLLLLLVCSQVTAESGCLRLLLLGRKGLNFESVILCPESLNLALHLIDTGPQRRLLRLLIRDGGLKAGLQIVILRRHALPLLQLLDEALNLGLKLLHGSALVDGIFQDEVLGSAILLESLQTSAH